MLHNAGALHGEHKNLGMRVFLLTPVFPACARRSTEIKHSLLEE